MQQCLATLDIFPTERGNFSQPFWCKIWKSTYGSSHFRQRVLSLHTTPLFAADLTPHFLQLNLKHHRRWIVLWRICLAPTRDYRESNLDLVQTNSNFQHWTNASLRDIIITPSKILINLQSSSGWRITQQLLLFRLQITYV